MSDVAVEPLDPFISPTDLRMALGEEPDALGDDVAAWLCDWGSAAVRAEVAQTVNIITGDRITRWGDGSTVLLLPEIEVRDVSAVAVAGVDLDAEFYAWDRSGVLWRRDPHYYGLGRWPARVPVEVIYDHGWAPGSTQWQAAAQVALEVAARTYRNPGMLQSERIGDYSRSWVPRGSRGELTDGEKRSLDLLRTER